MNDVTMASLFGAMIESNYHDLTFNGFSNEKGESVGGSKSHKNGMNGDFRYLRKNKQGGRTDLFNNGEELGWKGLDEDRQNNFNDLLYKFGWKSILSQYYGESKNKLLRRCINDANNNHNDHLHNIQGYKPTLKEFINELYILFLIQFKNCKSEIQTSVNIIEKTDISSKKEVEKVDVYIINSIDKIYIGNKITEKDKVEFLKKMLSKSFEREIEKPYMWDIFTSSNDALLQFYHYKDFNINKFLYKSYFIKIDYEDARYEAILLINDSEDNIYNNMIVYENLSSEENYQRTTKIEEDKLEIQFKKVQLSKK